MESLGDFVGPLGLTGDIALILLGAWLVMKMRNGATSYKVETGIVDQLGKISGALILVTERLSQLPTRDNITGLRESIRSDIQEAVGPVSTSIAALDTAIGTLEGEVSKMRISR